MSTTKMSTPIAGKVSSLTFNDEKVGGRVDMSLALERGEVDGSHMDSGGWSDFMKGRRSASISFSLRYIEDDPGQEALMDDYFGSSEIPVPVVFTQRTGVGLKEFECLGFVTSLDISSADESPQDITGNLRLTGPVTPVDQE